MSEVKNQFIAREIPERQKELGEIVGSDPLKFDVAWPSFSDEALKFLDNACFHRVGMAFRTWATDDLGKSLLSQIKEIQVKNVSGEAKATLVNGKTLSLEGDYAKGVSGAVSDGEIAGVLNAGLRIKYQRLLKTLKVIQLPGRVQEAKKDIDLDIVFVPDFVSLTTENAVEFFDNICCHRTLAALRSIRDVYGVDKARNVKIVKHRHLDSRSLSFDVSTGTLDIAQPIDRSNAKVDYYSNDEIFVELEKALGLKALKELSTLKKQIEERTKEVQEIASSQINYQVDYGSFQTDEELKCVDNVTCHRVNMAFRSFDKITKAYVQKNIKTVVIKCVANAADKVCRVDKATGELILHCAYSAGLSGAFSDNVILKTLKDASK